MLWDLLGIVLSDVVIPDDTCSTRGDSTRPLSSSDSTDSDSVLELFDLTQFPSLPSPSSSPDSDFDVLALDNESHNAASKAVADSLYSGVDPFTIGMDRLAGNRYWFESCPVSSCYQRIDMHIDSIRKHVQTTHNKNEICCGCGQWITGGVEVLSCHISDFHFRTDSIRCRSCKTVKKESDFAVHLTTCPKLAHHRNSKAAKVDSTALCTAEKFFGEEDEFATYKWYTKSGRLIL